MAVAALAVGTVFSAVGQYQAGETNKAIAEHNAQLGRFRALDSEKRGRELETQTRSNFNRLKSEQKVGFASQNIQLDSGVTAEIEADTAMIAELEVNAVRNNAAMEAWGFREGAAESVLSGQLAQAQGRFGAAGTLLSGLGAAGAAKGK